MSPLISNIYLRQLDELMKERGQRIVRFADDFVILCRSQKGAERVMRSVTRYLENDLGLALHPTKTKVVDVHQEPFTFLGFEFYKHFRRIDPKNEKNPLLKGEILWLIRIEKLKRLTSLFRICRMIFKTLQLL